MRTSRRAAVLAVLLALVCVARQAETPFEQWSSTRFNLWQNAPSPNYTAGWSTLPLRNITQFLEPFASVIWVVAVNSEANPGYRLIDLDSQREIVSDSYIPQNTRFEVLERNGLRATLLMVSPYNAKVLSCSKTRCDFVAQTLFAFGTVNKVQVANASLAYCGTDRGLFRLTLENATLHAAPLRVLDERVYDIAYSSELNVLAIGTMLRLWIYYEKFDYWRYEYTGVVIDNATTLVFRASDQALFVGSDLAVNVLDWYLPENQTRPFYKIWRAGFTGGLPAPNLTISASFGDRVYVGGIYGLASFRGAINDICPLNYTIRRDWQGLGQFASTTTPWRYFYEQA